MSLSGSSDATSTSSRKRPVVYVDIPSSTLHLSLENRRHSLQKMSKRKGVAQAPLSSRELNRTEVSATSSESGVAKKRKISSGKSAKIPYVLIEEKKIRKPAYDPEFPNGFFYCHQCNKKRAKDVELQCTVNENVPCKAKYCKMCLKNRYGEDAEQIKQRGLPTKSGERAGHTVDAGYIWKCPKCADICNCCRCRKAKGLAPTGNLTNMARKLGNSAADLLARDPNAIGIIGRKGQSSSAKSEQKVKSDGTDGTGTLPVPKIKAKETKRKVPRKIPESPIWQEVTTELNLTQAEDRFFIRETVMRLAPLMNVSAKHIEELDEFDTLSDVAAKSLILNILGLVAADAEKDSQQAIKETMKRITSSGMNLSTLWNHLSQLRQSVPTEILDFPDPTPSEIETYRTRAGLSVSQPIQLLPVLIGLLESALQSASVRVEMDNGLKDIRDRNKEYFASLRQESERWDEVKTDFEADRTSKDALSEKEKEKFAVLRTEHRDKLADIEFTHRENIQRYSPRFRRLGKDHEGRIYYVSSAFQTKRGPSLEEIKSMGKWSWFLAVWGVGGPSVKAPVEEEEEDSTDDEDGDKWWGFCEPKEIKKLAKWIAATANVPKEVKENHRATESDIEMLDSNSRASSPLSELSSLSSSSSSSDEIKEDVEWQDTNLLEEGPVSMKQVDELVRGLQEYSDYLSWRINQLIGSRGNEDDRTGTRGGKAEVATNQFYGGKH